MKSLAPAFYKIENSKKPINALFLASVVRLETGNGTSYSYRARNNVGGNWAYKVNRLAIDSMQKSWGL